jgi:hypothetical protein
MKIRPDHGDPSCLNYAGEQAATDSGVRTETNAAAIVPEYSATKKALGGAA